MTDIIVRREMTEIDGVVQDHTCVRRGSGGAILQEYSVLVAVKFNLGRVVARSGRGGHAQDRD